MPQTENSSQHPDLEQFKATLRESKLPDDAKMAVVRSFAKSVQSGNGKDSQNQYAHSINDIPGVPDGLKVKLMTLRFPQLAPQGVAHPPPGAPQPKSDTSPSWFDKPLAPVDKLIAGPEKSQPWYEQFGRGVVQGGAETGADLTSPKNLAIMGTMAGANLIPGVGELVDAGASALMGEEQLREMYNSWPEIKKAYDANDWGKIGNLVGKDAASAFVAYKAGKRGADKLKGKFGEGPIPDTRPAGANRATPPPPGAPPTYPLVEAGTPQAQPQAQGGPETATPPPGAKLGHPEPNSQPAEPGTDGSGPMTYEVALERAKTLPKEELAKHVQQMLGAAMAQAENMPKDKRADFIKAAKGYIETFEKILAEHEAVKDSGPSEFKPKGKKLDYEKLESELRKSEPKSKKPASKQEQPKETEIKPESNVGQSADPEMTSRVKNQLDSAKAKGIKKLKLTIDRPGKQPLHIGVNADMDSPESIAAALAKHGASGKVQAESSDPDRPLKWSFYIGGGPAPPGAK